MIRSLKPADVDQIRELLGRVENFGSVEIDVAMELINIAATDQTQKDYKVFVFERDGKILGYHCTGRRPLTDGVYDLYWIVADPNSPVKGIGKALVEHAQDFVKQQKGRWLLAETSSKESYSSARNFYLRNNFSIISEINDFYSVGDNLLVFGKYFNNKNKTED